MKKLILLGLYGALAFVGASFAFAQEEAAVIEVTTPDAAVENLVIDNPSLASGGEVKGSFIVENINQEALPEIYYRIFITGKHDADGNPTVVYGVQNAGPVHLYGEETRYIPFSVVIPEGVAGELGIRVQAYLKDETPLGWSEEMITVSGEASKLTTTSGSITSGGTEYGLQEGPAFDPAEAVPVKIKVTSTEAGIVSVSPRIVLFNANDAFREIDSRALEAFAAAAGTNEYTVSVTAPNEPGTYTGFIDFGNDSGRVLPTLGIRFIVRGDTATISVVRANVDTVVKGDLFDLSVSYAGAPIDLTRGVFPQLGDANLKVKIFNENNKLVASDEQTIDLNNPGETTFALEAEEAAQGMRAEVSIVKDGETLAYSYNQLSKSDVTFVPSDSKVSPETMIKLAFLAVLVLVVIVVVYGIVASRKANTTTIAILIVALGAGVAYLIVDKTPSSQASTFPAPLISVSLSPTKPAPGTQFKVKGSAMVAICLNRAAVTSGSVGFNGRQLGTFYKQSYETGDKDVIPFTTYFSFTTRAPAAAGQYNGTVRAATTYTNNGEFNATTNSTKKYTVNVVDATTDKCTNITGIQSTIPTGMTASGGICSPSTNDCVGDSCDGGDGDPNPPDDSCPADLYSCDGVAWGACVNGTRSRTCQLVKDCPNVNSQANVETQSCTVGDEEPPVCTYPAPDGSCPAPDMEFTATPKIISKGGSCTLRWEVEGAEECKLDGDIVSPTTGSQVKSPTQTTVYQLVCKNGPSTASRVASCNVQDVSEE